MLNEKDAKRFWSRVKRLDSGCWEWTGTVDGCGYGLITIKNKSHRTHRLYWAMSMGPIAAGLLVLHKCDNPPCLNPAHLFLGTNKDNAVDKIKKGRQGPGRAKLTRQEATEIRRLYATGNYFQRELANLYGVSRSTIATISLGRSWVGTSTKH